jgi:hypothetical protein
MYPNIFRTSDNKNNETQFYNTMIKMTYEKLSESLYSSSVYGSLHRLESILAYESNCDQTNV